MSETRKRRILSLFLRAFGIACLAFLIAGLLVPKVGANRFRGRIQTALETALGRKVEIAEIKFDLFTGPGFALKGVTIAEDPAFGLEPAAYVGKLEAIPRVWSLFSRRLEFASIRLEDASLNLTKTGAASEPGRWNFQPLVNRSLIMAFPEIHVRGGRINFKFGETKAVFYLTDTDLDIYPPTTGDSWSVRFSGAPARTDRPAHGFGAFSAKGTWSASKNLDLDLELERSAVGEMITLVHGESVGVHGSVSARLHLAGPLDQIRINGRLYVEDVHRWDVIPPKGPGWPLNLAGRLNLPGQVIELESSSSGSQTLPLSLRFRAANYLSRPHWSMAVNWNRFPLEPLLDLAHHMGLPLPPRLGLAGTLDGALDYDSEGSLQGEVAFHDTALTIPDSQPVRFEKARLEVMDGAVRLTPAVVRTAGDDQAELQASWRWATREFEIAISSAHMQVSALRSQAALAAIPWLEQPTSGAWAGHLRYTNAGDQPGWNGQIEIRDADFPVPGLAEPVRLESARAQIAGARLVLDRIRAHSGKIALEGEYRYEPGAPRPDRFRLLIAEADADELERLLMPTIYRRRGLLARALNLGRAPVPDWLAARRMEGSVSIGTLNLAGNRLEKVRARVRWDGTRARLDRLAATVEGGQVSGMLNVNMRGTGPAYLFSGKLAGMSCRAGTVDAEGVVETRGTGLELLANLRSRGLFTAEDVALGTVPAIESVSGLYSMVWARPEPRFTFSSLKLSAGEEVYTGAGATQDNGRLTFVLTSGAKQMHLSGTLAKLKVDEPTAP